MQKDSKYRMMHGPLRIKPCWRCDDPLGVFRRQNTAYNDEKSNWAFHCDPCQQRADEYWDDMWSDYYAGCM